MFLPISDAPNPPGRPLVTWALIAVNVAIYLLAAVVLGGPADPSSPAVQELLRDFGRGTVAPGLTNYDLFVLEYGFKPAHASVLTLFSSMFLHGG
ncbi:MAG: hypothetical protein ACPGPE_09105, partial [Planctomycetota bacterium]